MSHTVSGIGTTSYTWDVAAGLPVVLQDGTNTGACPENSRRVYGLDLISATDGGGDQTYFSYDGLGLPAGRHGSTTDLTDDEGDAVDGYTYDVFGALRSGSPGATDFLFTGEQLDADSEMYYLRARYYDPAIGRFLGRDPLPVGNLYAYVGNNPVNRVDPSGLMHIADVGGVRPKEGGSFGPGYLLCYEGYGCWVSDVLPANMICFPGPPDQPLPCQSANYGGSSWSEFVNAIVSPLLDPVLDALSSECGQGIAAGLALTGIGVASVGSGVAFVEAGGVLTYSAGAAATSASAAGAATLGPDPSATLTRVIGLALTTRKIEKCLP